MSTKSSFLTITFIFLTMLLIAQSAVPLSKRVASYDIEVTLDTENRYLLGKEKLYWKNPSQDTIRELRFHLYWNAFKNTKSTWLGKGGGIAGLPEAEPGENIWGWSQIDAMTDPAGNDLTQDMEFIHPDDDNEHDRTVLRVPLVNPVLPNDSTTISIDFTNKIPKLFARTGYGRDYYFMAHWFPKIGVYEPAGMRYSEGAWNCHQFHSVTEFYADFGEYNVSITAPSEYIVGASGALKSKKEKDGQTTHVYHVADVIDYAWVASPQLIEATTTWENVSIRLLYHPSHEGLKDRYLLAAKQTLDYFKEYIGTYPFPTLTIVSPPIYGIRSSGMEYSTLVTGASFAAMPEWIRTPEIVTAHEIVHQFFQQIVATNEMEEAFLDEGMTSYYESRVIDHYYGDKSSNFEYLGFRAGGEEMQRAGYLGLPNPKVTGNFPTGWKTHNQRAFRTMTYDKTATWLRTLEGLVGWDCMNDIMRTYYDTWKFRHPAVTDFIEVVNQVVAKHHGTRFGENMNWYFEQVVYGTDICDYEVAYIINRTVEDDFGVFEDRVVLRAEEEETTNDTTIYTSKVGIHRLGEIIVPVDVKIYFADGTSEIREWNGLERSYEFVYKGTNKIIAAEVDPLQKIYLDTNFFNNSLTKEPNTKPIWKYVSKFLSYLQNVMQTISFLV